jgi:hypothetical protein
MTGKTTTDPIATFFSFELVISTWHESIPCEITTKAGARCRRPATWRADAHGCEQRLMCTGHLQHWLRRVEAVLRTHGRTQCRLCGQWFKRLEDVHLAVRL